MEEKRRVLTETEMLQMKQQGCRVDDWTTITVSQGFTADKLYNCHFGANIYIGNNVCISGVRGVLSDYEIYDDAYIQDVGEIICPKSSSFGNGVEVVVVNEGGGREVPIFEGITSQIAYVIAMYRNRKATIEKLAGMIAQIVTEHTSDRGVIGQGARITGCGTIDSVRVGAGAVLRGVTVLKNGTVCSSPEAPTTIGYGAIVYDFITAQGVTIDNGAILKRCYIGESCHIDSGFSGIDTLFFANCDFANGEACSVFAGPYTVSHHRSSLLIAGMFSFFNAGSGTNQSNHLFKTGAVHQAIHERGCKFSSNGYIMAPAKTGAFSVVLGRHSGHHNSADFPFSYLVESEDKSYLIPAANLRSYGTVRDIAKWPARDKRRGEKHDLINFEEHNPYLGQRIAKAIEVSETLLAKEGVDVYNYERMRIKGVMLRRGMGLYNLANNATIGAILTSCGEAADAKITEEEIAASRGSWIDVSGMYAPRDMVVSLLDRVDSGEYCEMSQIEAAFKHVHSNYKAYAYQWALAQLKGTDIEKAVIRAKELGEKDRNSLKEMTNADAQQDAGAPMMTGYGIDATDRSEIVADFETVRKR